MQEGVGLTLPITTMKIINKIISVLQTELSYANVTITIRQKLEPLLAIVTYLKEYSNLPNKYNTHIILIYIYYIICDYITIYCYYCCYCYRVCCNEFIGMVEDVVHRAKRQSVIDNDTEIGCVYEINTMLNKIIQQH
jgi:hypothetical protein